MAEVSGDLDIGEEAILLLDGETTPEGSPTPPPPPPPPTQRRKTIHMLPAESVVAILEFLRATDLVSVSETDKTVFSQTRIKLAIAYQLNTVSLLAAIF